MRLIILAASLLAAVPALASEPTLYDRVDDLLAADPLLAKQLGKPAPQMQQLQWMVGSWTIEAGLVGSDKRKQQGTATIRSVLDGTWLESADTYPSGVQDLGFITFDIVTKQWISIGLDSTGNAVRAFSSGWQGSSLAFEARNETVVGQRVTLRQTLARISSDEFTLTNEERLANGSWEVLDEYRYRRVKR